MIKSSSTLIPIFMILLMILINITYLASQINSDYNTPLFKLNGDEEEEEEEEELEGEAEELGSLAFYGGLLLTGGYVGLKHTRRYIKLDPKLIRLSLDVHSIGNIILAPIAILHGYLNMEYAGPIEYAAAILIILLVLSGATMRYFRNRKAKIVARMIHSQRALAILLFILLLLHITRVD